MTVTADRQDADPFAGDLVTQTAGPPPREGERSLIWLGIREHEEVDRGELNDSKHGESGLGGDFQRRSCRYGADWTGLPG